MTELKRVLLLHTGGTLGMRGQPLEPSSYEAALTESVPELTELARIETRIVCNLDSSDMGPERWCELARTVAEARDRYDGFVIVHGTDTMPYSACALAFSLQGLDRPVILTGAQRPLASLRTDARRNLADAVELATCNIPEVGICFDGFLLRGCRTTKSDARSYHAFNSPGCAPLARLGVDVDVGDHIRRPTVPFRCDPRFDDRVMVVYVTPGLNPSVLERVIAPETGIRGVVLAAFGVGTVPCADRPIAPVVARAVAAGITVLVVTQSLGPVDLGLYRNSLPLQEAGAIAGGEMVVEAAVTKLMHALAVYDDPADRRRYLEWNVAGEIR